MNSIHNRVVLIGGAGFIGNAIQCELLSSEIPILNIESKYIDLIDPNAQFQLKDVIKKTDSVVMLAALTPDRGRDSDTFVKNIQMQDSVLKALSDINVRHFIYFSSDAVYGTQEGLINESSNLNPTDVYGAMHASRELMLNKISNIPTAILRPTMVYGSGDTHKAYGPNRFMETSINENQIILFGDGEELRDYIAVEDVAKITRLILQKNYVGVLNIATGNSITFKSIANVIKDNIKHPISIGRMQRVNNIFHRHFDITNFIKLFPDYKFKEIEQYLRSC